MQRGQFWRLSALTGIFVFSTEGSQTITRRHDNRLSALTGIFVFSTRTTRSGHARMLQSQCPHGHFCFFHVLGKLFSAHSGYQVSVPSRAFLFFPPSGAGIWCRLVGWGLSALTGIFVFSTRFQKLGAGPPLIARLSALTGIFVFSTSLIVVVVILAASGLSALTGIFVFSTPQGQRCARQGQGLSALTGIFVFSTEAGRAAED